MNVPVAAGGIALGLGVTLLALLGGSKKAHAVPSGGLQPADDDLAAVADQAPPGAVVVADEGENVAIVDPGVQVPPLPTDDEDEDEAGAVELEEEFSVEPPPEDIDAAADELDAHAGDEDAELTEEVEAEEVGAIPPQSPQSPVVVAPPNAEPPLAPPPPPNSAEENVDRMFAAVLLRAEANKGWKSAYKEEVRAYQQRKGLTADGLFGPGTALKLASEIGVAPIVRYWPKGSWKGDAKFMSYVQALNSIGVDSSREQGQGYGSDQKPISPLVTL